jgi:hypothetical protein
MFFQHILKGINGINEHEAREILEKTGIQSNWLRASDGISAEEIMDKLTERNLLWHLQRYDRVDRRTNAPFCESTPFISTTAGTVEPDLIRSRNYLHDAFYRAARFATQQFRSGGYIFHGYVYTLGKKAIALQEFAEEVRDLHVYTGYLRYRYEGEVTAKIEIPPVRLHRAEWYWGPTLHEELSLGKDPEKKELLNPVFRPPEDYSNVRGML